MIFVVESLTLWPDAMWSGSLRVVYVCKHCASEILPRLIADAVIDESMSTVEVLQEWVGKLYTRYLEAAVFLLHERRGR